MRLFAGQKKTPIGLDVGTEAVKAVQLAGSPGAWSIAAATLIPRGERDASQDASAPPTSLTDDELERVARILSRQGFTGNRIVTAVPHELLRGGIIEMPSRDSGAPLEQIARMETATMHRLNPSGLELAWAELPATGRQHDLTRAMVAACPHDAAETMMDRFAAHGLEIVVLDVAASALVRLADAGTRSRDTVLAVIDLGQEAATLIIIHQGMPIYERRLSEAGFRRLGQELTQQFELEPGVARYLLEDVGLLDDADHPDAMPAEMLEIVNEHLDDLVRELNVSLTYARHQYPDVPIGPLMLVGGAARMPGLADALARHVEQDLCVLTPAAEVAASPAALQQAGDPAMSLAAALAMHERGADA